MYKVQSKSHIHPCLFFLNYNLNLFDRSMNVSTSPVKGNKSIQNMRKTSINIMVANLCPNHSNLSFRLKFCNIPSRRIRKCSSESQYGLKTLISSQFKFQPIFCTVLIFRLMLMLRITFVWVKRNLVGCKSMLRSV